MFSLFAEGLVGRVGVITDETLWYSEVPFDMCHMCLQGSSVGDIHTYCCYTLFLLIKICEIVMAETWRKR